MSTIPYRVFHVMVGKAHPTFISCASAEAGVEMLDGHSQAEAPLPGDQYEQRLERTRASIFRDFWGITCVFFGFHGLAFAILISGSLLLSTDVFMETALGGAIVAWLISVVLAVLQFVVALWNALTVRWWVTALGVLPWMIIATEAFVPLMFALL